METKNMYYQPSGSFSPKSIIQLLIGGFVVAFVLAGVYVYAGIIGKYALVRGITLLLFGGLLGYSLFLTAKKTEMLNSKVMVGCSIAVGIFAVYACWLIWMRGYTGRDGDPTLFWSPFTLFSKVYAISGADDFEIFNINVGRVFMLTIWSLEALVIIAMTALIAKFSLESSPYCDNCGHWIIERRDVKKFGPFEHIQFSENLADELENNNFSTLKNLKNVDEDSYPHTIIENTICSECGHLNLLSVKTIVQDTSDKEVKEIPETLVEHLIITIDQIAWLTDKQ